MNPVTNKGKNSDLDTTCTSTSSNDSGVRVSTLKHLSLEVLKKQFVNYTIVDERFTQKTPPETPPEMHQSETQPVPSCSKDVSCEDTKKAVPEPTCISSSSYTVSSDFSGGETDGSEVDLFDTLESEGNMYGDIYGQEEQDVGDIGIEVVSEEVDEVSDAVIEVVRQEEQEVLSEEEQEVVSEEVQVLAEGGQVEEEQEVVSEEVQVLAEGGQVEEVQEVLSEEVQVLLEGGQVEEVQEVLSEEVQVLAEGEQVEEEQEVLSDEEQEVLSEEEQEVVSEEVQVLAEGGQVEEEQEVVSEEVQVLAEGGQVEEEQEVVSEEVQVLAEGGQVEEEQEVLSEEVQVVAEGEQVEEVQEVVSEEVQVVQRGDVSTSQDSSVPPFMCSTPPRKTGTPKPSFLHGPDILQKPLCELEIRQRWLAVNVWKKQVFYKYETYVPKTVRSEPTPPHAESARLYLKTIINRKRKDVVVASSSSSQSILVKVCFKVL